MRRRALLIGAPLDGLAGVPNDIAAMERMLGGRGFEVARCVGEEATRATVLGAYGRLIARTDPGDAAVVYFSGHGGLARSDGGGEVLQFIAPVDYPASRPGDFRGIASAELSALLTRLTERTENATVILDCCHAARMSRDPSLRARALSQVASYEAVRAHLDRLQREGALGPESSWAAGNPLAVRIVACATNESAYEYRDRSGRCIGMLTEALIDALTEPGDGRVTWAALMDRVRRDVLDLAPTQRPEVEGPSRRFVFEAAQDDAVAALRVTEAVRPGRARLAAASLLGVRVGDEFVIVPPGAGEERPDPIGALAVDEVGPRYAEGRLTLRPGSDRVPLGARALRFTTSVPAFPVLLPPPGSVGPPGAAELAGAVAASAALRVVGAEERWLARVIVGARGELTIADRLGPLHPPRPPGPGTVAAVLRDLGALAQASELLRSTASGFGTDWRLDAYVDVVWGVVRRGVRHKLPSSGASVRLGEDVYIEVRNNDSRMLFISLVDVGVSGRITVLTQDSPSGAPLGPGRRFEFSGTLGWPDELDRAVARPETVLVLVSASPHDVSALEQDGAGDRTRIAVVDDSDAGSAAGIDVHRVAFELEAVRQ